MIRAIILGFAGVLLRTDDHGARAALDAQLGLPPGTVEHTLHGTDLWIQAQLGRISSQAYWDGVAEMLRLKPGDIPALREAYFGGDRLDESLVDLIRELRAGGLRIALLSNATLDLTDRLEAFGIADLFDHVLVSARLGVMKPDPTAFRIALTALGMPAQDVLFVDNIPSHVEGARAVGMPAILFHPALDLRAELARHLTADLPR